MIALASGSQGNAAFVEIEGTRLLIDAGLPAKELEARLVGCGVDPARIDAVLLSHEHYDHVRGALKFSRRFGVPVVASWDTLHAMDRSPQAFAGWIELAVGRDVKLGSVTVSSFPVPHDAACPVGFVIAANGVRVGVATDLGHATPEIVESLAGCDVLMLESNHDPLLLMMLEMRLSDQIAGMDRRWRRNIAGMAEVVFGSKPARRWFEVQKEDQLPPEIAEIIRNAIESSDRVQKDRYTAILGKESSILN